MLSKLSSYLFKECKKKTISLGLIVEMAFLIKYLVAYSFFFISTNCDFVRALIKWSYIASQCTGAK